MNDLKEILETYDPISLNEMDSVKLMNRTDTKYVFYIDQLPAFLEEIKESYRVLEVNQCRLNRYESLYFDTEDFQMYMHHHNGKSNRYKVRFRNYVESNEKFFEIKFKNNKGRTLKDRIKRKEQEFIINGKSEEFLHIKTHYLSSSLTPKLWVNYSRITLVHKAASERLTIDVDLLFKNGTDQKYLPNIVIAELKQAKRANTCFAGVMKKHHIKKGSISKYCFGVIFLYDHIKKNNFKPKLLTFNKIYHGPN